MVGAVGVGSVGVYGAVPASPSPAPVPSPGSPSPYGPGTAGLCRIILMTITRVLALKFLLGSIFTLADPSRSVPILK
jgi:hypothetical protein